MKTIPGISDPVLQKAFGQSRRFLRRPYVTGVSIGEAYRGGKPAGTAVRLHVEQKLSDKVLTKAQRFPQSIEGVPIDVVERSFIIHSGGNYLEGNPDTKPQAYISPGQEIGAQGLEPGTAGMIVSDSSSPNAHYLLTAGHVLQNLQGTDVFQKDMFSASRIGYIHKCRINKRCDGGLVALDDSITWSNIPIDVNSEIIGFREVRINDILVKSGMMTGVTYARVKEVGECKIRTPDYSFRKMAGIILQPLETVDSSFCDSGDSGSIWFDESTGLAVGLHVAGDDNGIGYNDDVAFACNLTHVFDELGVGIASNQ